jgi:ribA/ribD-fused uncharacterized protein
METTIAGGKNKHYVVHSEKEIKGFFDDYRFLCNFHKVGVYYDGNWFPSTENAYMFAKLDPKDHTEEHLNTCQTLEPSDVKKYGRTIKLRSDWEDIKYDVMSSVVFDKFYRDKELRQKLLDTGDRYLEETNHWNDTYWGVCDNEGQNNLGKILMACREFWKN